MGVVIGFVVNALYALTSMCFHHVAYAFIAAIMLTAVAVRLALLPFSYRSFVASRHMREQLAEYKEIMGWDNDTWKKIGKELVVRTSQSSPAAVIIPFVVQCFVFVEVFSYMNNVVIHSSLMQEQTFLSSAFTDTVVYGSPVIFPVLITICVGISGGLSSWWMLRKKKDAATVLDMVTVVFLAIVAPVVTFFINMHTPMGLHIYLLTSCIWTIIQMLVFYRREITYERHHTTAKPQPLLFQFVT